MPACSHPFSPVLGAIDIDPTTLTGRITTDRASNCICRLDSVTMRPGAVVGCANR